MAGCILSLQPVGIQMLTFTCMKEDLIKVCLIMLLFLNSGCKMFLGATGNYKKPRVESVESIKLYLGPEKNYDGLYIVQTDSLLKFFFDSVGSSIPNVYIFNKERQNIYQSKSCAWANINQLDSLQSVEGWTVNPTFQISDIEKAVTLVDGKKPQPKHDYLVYFVWAKFIPKLSDKMIADMRKDFKEKRQNVYIGNINVDMQEK